MITLTQRPITAFAPAPIVVPLPQGNPADNVIETFYESEYNVTSDAEGWNDYRIEGERLQEPWTVTNRTPDVCDLSEFPVVTRLAAGVGQLTLEMNSAKVAVTLDMRSRGGVEFSELAGYVPGSIAGILSDEVASRLDNDKEVAYFTAPGVRNPNCWLADIDLSATSYDNNKFNNFTRLAPMTLVTPQHGILAGHWGGYFIGQIHRFYDAAGNRYERTIIGLSWAAPSHDLLVAVLDSPLPESIFPMKVPGPWWMRDFSNIDLSVRYYDGGLGFHLGPDKDCGLMQLGWAARYLPQTWCGTGVYDGETYPNAFVNASCIPISVARAGSFLSSYDDKFFIQPVTGFSGSPTCAILNGEPLFLWAMWGAHNGPAPFSNPDWINAVIRAANADAVAHGHSAPEDFEVTVADDPTL